MLLDIMRELGYNYDPYFYDSPDEEIDISKLSEEELIAAVDPVDCAGCLHMNKLKSASMTMAPIFQLGIGYLVNGMRPLLIDKNTWPAAAKHTLPFLLPLMLLLASWGVVEDTTKMHLPLHAICAFFVVPKAFGKLRIVFDGRPLNEVMRPPPPVCLPTIAEVLLRLSTTRPQVVFLADFRHFFHQIPLPEDFKVVGSAIRQPDSSPGAASGAFFRCLTLPMGLSWAPFFAQSLSWIFLTFAQPGAPQFFRHSATERLPTFADVINEEGEVVGFATIIYDNLIVATNSVDPSFHAKLQKRLTGNAKYFNFRFKEFFKYRSHPGDTKAPIRGYNVLDEKQPCPPLPIFMGVEFSLSPIAWRHVAKRKEKAKAIIGPPRTFRDVAKKVGLIIWDACVRQIRLSSVKHIIDVLKHLHISSKKGWDVDIPADLCSATWLHDADLILVEIAENNWHFPKSPREAPGMAEIFAASDASDSQGGGVIFDSGGGVRDHISYKEKLSIHIFIKESKALMKLVYRIIKYHTTGPTIIIIAIDNIPARRAFEKAYSTNSAVCKIVERVYCRLDAVGHELRLVDIDTKLNVGDCMTRNDHGHGPDDVCIPRLTATWEVLHGIIPGRKRPSVSSSKISSLNLVDAEGDSDSDLSDAEIESDWFISSTSYS